MPSIFRPGLFDGHVAIVTGGGSGIGLAIARTLCELGAKVAIGGRDVEKLARAKEALAATGAVVHAGPCDIRDVEQVAAFVKGTREALGEVSVLVNNAGGQFPTPAEDLSTKGWDAVVRNNLSGTFYVTREVATASMIPRKRGRIVNVIAQIARGFPGMVHTGAARAGVENMTKTLAIEWAAARRGRQRGRARRHPLERDRALPARAARDGPPQHPCQAHRHLRGGGRALRVPRQRRRLVRHRARRGTSTAARTSGATPGSSPTARSPPRPTSSASSEL